MHPGERIRDLRKKRGLTLRELSDRTSMTINGLSRVELGHTTPTSFTLEKIAGALGVEVGDLYPKVLAR